MPELRLAKTRQSLPEGYQFGDAGRDNGRPVRVYVGNISHIEYVSDAEWKALGGRLWVHGASSDADHQDVVEGAQS